VIGDVGKILGVVSFSTQCNENRLGSLSSASKIEVSHDFAKAPQNKISINNLSPVYQMLFFLWVLGNTETRETSAQATRQTVKTLHLVSALHIPERAPDSVDG
jgi:hypothetical protein